MSEFVDLANSTRLGRVFFVLSHQGSRGKGQVLPTVTNPQQSRGLLNIFIPSHRVTVVRWVFFEYPMCVSQLLTSRVVLILYRLITYPVGSLANADVRI